MITEEKERISGIHGNFVICDCQREYSESLFGIFVRKYSGKFHILLIEEEYGEEQIEEIKAGKVYVLSEKEKACVRDGISVFRYQPAGKIMETVLFCQVNPAKKERPRIRDEPVLNGILGVYSPVHRIGKTKFALRLGSQIVLRKAGQHESGNKNQYNDRADKGTGLYSAYEK